MMTAASAAIHREVGEALRGAESSSSTAAAAKHHILQHRFFERDCASPSASSVATVDSDHSASTTASLNSTSFSPSDSDCAPTEGLDEILKEMSKTNDDRYDKYFTLGFGVRFLNSNKDFKIVLFTNRTELLSRSLVKLMPKYATQVQSFPYMNHWKYNFGYTPSETNNHSYLYSTMNNSEISSSVGSFPYNNGEAHVYASKKSLSQFSNQDKKSLESQTTASSIMTQPSSSLMSSSQYPLSNTTSQSSIGYQAASKIHFNFYDEDDFNNINQHPTMVRTTNY